MSLPQAYTTAKERLESFRKTVITDLVGGRVKAGLDAGHDSMKKYSSVIQSLSVTPYLFGEVSRSALALKLKGMDVGSGKIRMVQSRFTLGEAEYPIQETKAVPLMKLPQVDVFQFTPFSDINLFKNANAETLKSYILITADSGTFEDTPQVEDSQKDYYQFVPTRKDKGTWEILNPRLEFTQYKYIEGECIILMVDLYGKNTLDQNWYVLFLWLSPTLRDDSNNSRSEEFVAYGFRYCGDREVIVSLAGQQMYGSEHDVYVLRTTERAGLEWVLAGDGIDTKPDVDIGIWYNYFKATMLPVEGDMGTVVPEPDSVTEVQGESNFQADATPNSGYKFLYWRRNGVIFSYTAHLLSPMLRDNKFEAVFEHI
jgi:hypothetical protein